MSGAWKNVGMTKLEWHTRVTEKGEEMGGGGGGGGGGRGRESVLSFGIWIHGRGQRGGGGDPTLEKEESY